MNKKLAPNQIDSKISESVREEKSFDPDTTVLWQNLQFIKNGDILIFVPYS